MYPVIKTVALLLVMELFFAACRPAETTPSVVPAYSTADPSQPYMVRVTGADFQWHVLYPGPDGKLDTTDDILSRRDLHLPEETEVVVQLQSKDYIYTLALPELELKEIAVPDLAFALRFRTGPPRTFHMLGDQMCGYTHSNLLGTLTVHARDQYSQWLAKERLASVVPSLPGQ